MTSANSHRLSIPSVYRSGKLYDVPGPETTWSSSPKASTARASSTITEPAVPNVNRSGKFCHTSTNSPSTVHANPCHAGGKAPRPRLVLNVSRSGKPCHLSFADAKRGERASPERQPLRQALSRLSDSPPAVIILNVNHSGKPYQTLHFVNEPDPRFVLNVNRSGKS